MFICVIIAILVLVGGVAAMVKIDDFEINTSLGVLLVFIIALLLLPHIAVDKSSGTTVGIITAVDKNFFGTYTIYLKTTEQKEDEYCVESEEIVKIAKDGLNKKVQLFYGERVGLYELNQCKSAPVDKIELMED